MISGTAWWGAVSLAFKAGIASLATLVTEELLQCALCALWIAAFALLHVRAAPYDNTVFNGLELLASCSLLATSIISTLLATSLMPGAGGVTATTVFATPAAAAATGTGSGSASGTAAELSPLESQVTTLLLIINIGTLAILAAAWLRYTMEARFRQLESRLSRHCAWCCCFRGSAKAHALSSLGHEGVIKQQSPLYGHGLLRSQASVVRDLEFVNLLSLSRATGPGPTTLPAAASTSRGTLATASRSHGLASPAPAPSSSGSPAGYAAAASSSSDHSAVVSGGFAGSMPAQAQAHEHHDDEWDDGGKAAGHDDAATDALRRAEFRPSGL